MYDYDSCCDQKQYCCTNPNTNKKTVAPFFFWNINRFRIGEFNCFYSNFDCNGLTFLFDRLVWQLGFGFLYIFYNIQLWIIGFWNNIWALTKIVKNFTFLIAVVYNLIWVGFYRPENCKWHLLRFNHNSIFPCYGARVFSIRCWMNLNEIAIKSYKC